MKKVIFSLILFVCFASLGIAQFGYKKEYKTIDGIEIKYKYSHEKVFDKSSPIHLRLKIKNTNDYAIELSFSVFMESGFTNIKQSEIINICIPPNNTRLGKMHGLYFETGVNDKNLFKNKDIEWYIEPFTITETDKCLKENKEK